MDPILSSTVITWSNLSRDFTPAMREAGSEHTAYLSLGGWGWGWGWGGVGVVGGGGWGGGGVGWGGGGGGRESYGVSVMRILQKIDRVMTVPLCIWHRT